MLGHTEGPLNNYIYQFHMPLFFFLSGMVYKDKKDQSLIKLSLGKIRSLYLPYLYYGMAFLLLHNVFYKLNIYSNASSFNGSVQKLYGAKDFFKQFINTITCSSREQVGGAMWFLVSLLTASILFIILRRVLNRFNRREIYLGIIISCLFFIGYYTNLPRYFSISLIALFFYYLGYLYKEFKERIKFNFLIFIASVLAICALTEVNEVSMVSNKYTNPILLIVSSLVGIYMILYLSKSIEGTFLDNKFTFIGRNTMVIMMLHFLSFKVVSFIGVLIKEENIKLIGSFPVLYSTGFWWVVYGMVGVFLPLLSKYTVLKLKCFVTKDKKQLESIESKL